MIAYKVAELIKESPGFVVSLKNLFIAQRDDGKYIVVSDDQGKENVEEFALPYEAAYRFLELRKERGLGFDLNKEGECYGC